MILLGGLLLTTPNTVMALVHATPAREFWVRFVGGALFNVGWVYIGAASERLVPFYRWTVWGRMAVCSVLVLFVYLRIAENSMLVFASLDAIGFSATGLCYWNERGEAARWRSGFVNALGQPANLPTHQLPLS
jgi:hypothetical protein